MHDMWYSIKNEEGQDSGPTNDEDESKNKVSAYSNRIYFYSEVTRSNNLTLNKKIQELGSKYHSASEVMGLDNPIPLKIHINSFGGSVFAGFSSVDYILRSNVPTWTIIDGCAASAATLMSIVGSHRQIGRNSYMLIHQLSSGMWGKYEEMKDDMKNSKELMSRIKGLYTEHTKLPKKKLNEILKHDLWWDAETCLEYGLVDEII